MISSTLINFNFDYFEIHEIIHEIKKLKFISYFFFLQNALDLTAPASDVLLKNRLKSWFQLSGHPDGFAPAGPGTVWKRKTGGAENTERMVYEALSKDKELRDCIPR